MKKDIQFKFILLCWEEGGGEAAVLDKSKYIPVTLFIWQLNFFLKGIFLNIWREREKFMNKDIFLKLAIYFGMDKSTNFGIRYSIILQKKVF